MSNDPNQVENDIINISKIYSNAFKPFIKLVPERYINTEDLIQDLKILVSKWDGHASFSTRKSLKDNSDYIINSYGKAYIFVSENTRVDVIYRFYNEIISKGIKEMTINMLGLNDRKKYTQLISYLVLPFADMDLGVFSKSRETGETVNNFRFTAKTRLVEFFTSISDPMNKTFTVPKKIPDIKVNLMMHEKVAPIWYQRLSGTSNFTFYCYTDCKVCRGFIKVSYHDRDNRRYETIVFTKYLHSVNEPTVAVIVGNINKPLIPKSLRPMS